MSRLLRVNVAWNNSFRHIFGGFWRESVVITIFLSNVTFELY